jgi:biopolymer transport protein ExbB/TolQ
VTHKPTDADRPDNARVAGPLPQLGGTPISHAAALIIGAVTGILFLAVISILTTPGELAVIILFDYRTGGTPPYPFTIQNLSWLVFFVGITDIIWVSARGRMQRVQLSKLVVPEDEDAMFGERALSQIARRIAQGERRFYLQQVLLRAIWQFLSTRSVSQTTNVMSVSLELCERDVEGHYSLSRYLTWLIPTLGFIGTVWGIAMALGKIEINPDDAEAMRDAFNMALSELGVAFNTTLLALLLSAILVFLSQRAETYDEQTIGLIGEYCIDHLINKIYANDQE